MNPGSSAKKTRTCTPYLRIECPDCDVVPQNRVHWEQHRRIHTGEKPFRCTSCSYRASSASQVARHVQEVHGGRRFKCPEPDCKFTSSRNQNLVIHQKAVHQKEKSLSCSHPGCNFRTAWWGSLRSHKNAHTDEKPFACSYTGCSYRSTQRQKLDRHKKSFHLKIRNNWCHLCEKRFFSKSELQRHTLRMHTREGHDMDTCEDCASIFQRDFRKILLPRASHVRASSEKEEVVGKELANEEKHGSNSSPNLNSNLIDIHISIQKLILI